LSLCPCCLTALQDNRIRAFFNLAALKGDASDLESRCTTIVHSHDFNRHLTPFRAEFDAKDLCEARIVIGRYIR
jgi:DNA damage-binding protein 2